MEVPSHKQGGSMKGKLIMSFYRAAKPPSSAVQCTVAAATVAAANKSGPPLIPKTVSFKGREDHFGNEGDEHVDNKATSFISHVKERIKLEELNLSKEKSPVLHNH
ncbi:hypothetical protein CDL12_19070 [Handroanthus impetiginosus]|uniref:Uncharacterized protein n=1 Tax=Handroanthus impetiginosus TaxID=429701 RepID=A0A2G9GSX9_9LAMI|nr:hypothetical protein CDL12_19070 [Handroanthus impetiginosus]